MVYIYVLQLQSDKYYIGKTENPEFRLNDHFDSEGSAWTKKYKPIKIKEIIENCDAYDEDKYTKIYMSKYGIDNVRGSTYNTIQKEIDGETDKCYTCGKHVENMWKTCGKHVENMVILQVIVRKKPVSKRYRN